MEKTRGMQPEPFHATDRNLEAAPLCLDQEVPGTLEEAETHQVVLP